MGEKHQERRCKSVICSLNFLSSDTFFVISDHLKAVLIFGFIDPDVFNQVIAFPGQLFLKSDLQNLL